jgi:hypothetical protein
MKCIFVNRGTLTFLGSLWRHIDIIGSLEGTLTMRWQFEGVICTFPKKKLLLSLLVF